MAMSNGCPHCGGEGVPEVVAEGEALVCRACGEVLYDQVNADYLIKTLLALLDKQNGRPRPAGPRLPGI